jgi:hypothetical protein
VGPASAIGAAVAREEAYTCATIPGRQGGGLPNRTLRFAACGREAASGLLAVRETLLPTATVGNVLYHLV